MKRVVWFLAAMILLVSLASTLGSQTPWARAQGPVAPGPVSNGMPGWPTSGRTIPYHEPGRPSKAGDYTTQVTRLNVEGREEAVTLTGIDALLADGTMTDPLQGNYRLVQNDQIMAGMFADPLDTVYVSTFAGLAPNKQGTWGQSLGSGQNYDIAAGDLNGDGVDEQILAWIDDGGKINLSAGPKPGTGRFSSSPAVLITGSDEMHLLGRGRDNILYHSRRNSGGGWAEWDNTAGGLLLSAPAVVSRGTNAFDVFAMGIAADTAAYAEVYHARWENEAWQTFGNAIWQPVTADLRWPSLPAADPTLDLPAPAAVSRGGDQLDLFRLGPDNTLYWLQNDGTGWNSEWQSLGGMLASAPAAISLGPDHMQVFACGLDDALWYLVYDGSWGRSWRRMEGLGGGVYIDSQPSVVSTAPGELSVYVRGSDGLLYENHLDGSGWNRVGDTPFSSAPAATFSDLDDRVELFAVRQDGLVQWRSGESDWITLPRPEKRGRYTGSDVFRARYGIQVETGHFMGAGRELIAVSAIRDNGSFFVGLYDIRNGFQPDPLGQKLWYSSYWPGNYALDFNGRFDITVGDFDGLGVDQVMFGWTEWVVECSGFPPFCMPSGFQFVTKTVECSQNLDQLDCNSLEGPSEEYLSYYLSSSTFVWSLDTLHFHLAAGDIDGDDPYDELAVTAGGFNWDMHEAFRLIYDKELGDDHTWAAYHNVLNSWFPRPPADVVIADVYPGNGKEEIVFASGWAPGSVLYLDVWGWTADGQPEPIKQYQVGNAGTKYLALGAGDLNTDLTKDIGLLHCTASTCELQTFAYIAGNWQANTTGVIPWAGDSFARLATGNFTGEGLRVGRPNHWVQNKMTTPIAIINMPPKHRDLFKTGEGYISIEIRTQECTDQPDKLNCTHARHKTIDGDTSSTSYTTKNNWQLSQSLSLRLGIVTTSLEGSYGENFERVTKDIAASVFEDSAFAAEFDQLVYDGTNYSVWEYPVYEDDSGVASGLLTVVFPLLNQCQDDFCQPNSPAQRAGNICGEEEGWFLPRHQIFNVWSYPAVGTDFQDYGAYILDKDVTGGGKEFRANMSTIQTNITSTQITKSWGAGVEIHKKADKIPLLGIEIPFEFKSKTSYENQMGELQVEEVTLTDQTEISAYLAALEPGTKFREAASLYWSEMGYLVLDWQTDPIQAEALWGDNYSKPDPAFTLPFYGFPDPDNYQPTPCTDKAWKLYSRDVVVSPPFANAGSTVTASATVRSFSLEDWGDDIGEDPLVVRFYLGDPANNQVLGEGEIDFLARSVGPETVSTTFTIPDVSGKQRIYAVIDPGDAIDEVHDEDDLATDGTKVYGINNNTAFGLLEVGDADYVAPVLSALPAYEHLDFIFNGSPTSSDATAVANNGPQSNTETAVVSVFVPNDNLTETSRFELTSNPAINVAGVGGAFTLEVYQGSNSRGWSEPIQDFVLKSMDENTPPAAIALGYGDAVLDAAKLQLYRFTTKGWAVDSSCPGYQTLHFPDDNLLLVPVCKTGTFVFSDQPPPSTIYLPVVMRAAAARSGKGMDHVFAPRQMPDVLPLQADHKEVKR